MKNKYENIQNTPANLDNSGSDWRVMPFSHPERTIRLGTSFSGIGAIEHAFKRLGLNYEIMFAGDIDEDCKKSYFANYSILPERWHSDIHDFVATDFLGNIDLFVGGAPCQAFSMRGKRGGFDDTRGTLFREFARIVMECKPKVFIFENVRGMINHDHGHTWSTIKKTFEDDCNYQVYFQVLNGKNYGIPQSRERLFCIGFLKETDFKFPAPIPLGNTCIYDFLDHEFDVKYFLKQKGVNFVSRKLNYDKSYTQVNGQVMLCQKRNQQFNWHGDFVFHPILSSDDSVPSKDTVFAVSELETSYYIDDNLNRYVITPESGSRWRMNPGAGDFSGYGRFRKLTPRECLRLMGFDDSFKIAVPDTAAYKQSGNSIIVNVLIALLRQMDITKYGI